MKNNHSRIFKTALINIVMIFWIVAYVIDFIIIEGKIYFISSVPYYFKILNYSIRNVIIIRVQSNIKFLC